MYSGIIVPRIVWFVCELRVVTILMYMYIMLCALQ